MITSLQLTVVTALALSIDERHITVTPLDRSFFRVAVRREGEWLATEIDERSAQFIEVLNLHAARFSAKLVLTHGASVIPFNLSRAVGE